MIALYRQCTDLGSLPYLGGVLDQDHDHMLYFSAFASAEREHYRNG